MRILGLVGSPRKGGNTHLIVEEALAGAQEKGAETEIVLVSDLHFHFCQGCLGCRDSGACLQDDDLEDLLEKVEDADALIIGTPVYGHYLPGQFKAVFDRLNSMSMVVRPKPGGITEVISRLPKKKRNGVIIAVCGAPNPDMADPALNFLEGFLTVHGNGGSVERIAATGMNTLGQIKMSRAELIQIAKQYGLPEEVAAKTEEHNHALLQRAKESGGRLVEMD